MNNILVECGIIFALVIINGLLALSEMSVVTSRRLRLEDEAESGNSGAKAALSLIDNPNGFLSTVQVGITLVGIIAGVYSGTTLAVEIGEQLNHLPLIAPHGSSIAYFIVILIITILSLVFGELVPKRLALAYPEAIAKFVSPAFLVVAKGTVPLIWLLDTLTTFVLTPFRIKEMSSTEITEEDIKSMVEQGSEKGIIEEAEGEILSKVFRLGNRSAGSIMTPISDVEWLDSEKSVAEIWEQARISTHSNFPVAKGNLENLLGVISYKKLSEVFISKNVSSIENSVDEPLRIPTNISALEVLEIFRESKDHLALAFDEHGSLDGVLTLHDLLEAMVGSIAMEGEKEWVQRSDGSYLVSAAIDLVDLFELLDIEVNEEEVAPGYHSLGGFIFHQLGHIPKESEAFQFNNYRFEVVDMDGMRIDKVLIAKL